MVIWNGRYCTPSLLAALPISDDQKLGCIMNVTVAPGTLGVL